MEYSPQGRPWSEIYGPVDPNKLEADDADLQEEHRKDSAQEKKSKGSRMGGAASPFAMDNRDPNNLNPHIQVLWDDIVGEPEGLRTPDGCWNCSIKCYDGTRRCCYVLLVVLFAPFIACCNGCQFACLAFNQVWCVGPCLRLWKINMATVKRFWETWLLAVCSPICDVCGICFSKAKVRYQKLPDSNDQEPIDYFTV
ncbi:caveolin-1 isoform X2 [Penaeus vannamei]|uniref:caveolin-1 isoform X2 n=1 Tax=Penaeus vannamei TaxID=6689 RepID=UPI00387FA408